MWVGKNPLLLDRIFQKQMWVGDVIIHILFTIVISFTPILSSLQYVLGVSEVDFDFEFEPLDLLHSVGIVCFDVMY